MVHLRQGSAGARGAIPQLLEARRPDLSASVEALECVTLDHRQELEGVAKKWGMLAQRITQQRFPAAAAMLRLVQGEVHDAAAEVRALAGSGGIDGMF